MGRASKAAWKHAAWWLGGVVLVLHTACGTVPAPPGSEMAYLRRTALREQSLRAGLGPMPPSQRTYVEAERRKVEAPEASPPPGNWPEGASGDEELLAPLLACPTVGDFLELQRGVDMARVVQRLGDWSAVRLGAQGPLVDAKASQALTAKRASFLLKATQDYGAYAPVFALFIVHTAFDDELDALLRLLAMKKQLSQTLGSMEGVRQELERRGLKLKDYLERGERASDVLRGVKQAAVDGLNSSPASENARYLNMMAQLQQMPPAYQQAQAELEGELMQAHYAPGHAALGALDQLTFGVPLGFYHLGVGTAHGVGELWQGRYEQATRELAPAALLVALYAGGKGARYVAEGTGARLPLSEPRVEALRSVAWQVAERLGVDGLADLARYLRASREAAVFVGAGGEPAAVALYEERGDVARAQAWLAEARPEATGAPEPKGAPHGGVASLVDEAAGYSAEVVEAKLQDAEREAPGSRLPADVALLNKLQSTLDAPPPGVPEGHALWEDYRAYRQRRLAELELGQATKGPLRWEAYAPMRSAFARGLAFERSMVSLLRADASLPLAQRRWLQGFNQPRVEVHVGVSKEGVPGIRYADVLVIEARPRAGQPPRVETFSFKSRNLRLLEDTALEAQIAVDAQAALDYYGGAVDILRPSLKRRLSVHSVRLVYQGGELLPEVPQRLKTAMDKAQSTVQGVEVLVR